MTDEEMKDHARRLLEAQIDDYEYSNVYEDEGLADASEEELKQIHGYILTAKLEVKW